jgi:hypothetical protein
MAIHEPFEIQYWFVQVFSGNWDIFSLVSILAITAACAMFRMEMSSFLIMIVIYAGILLAAGQEFLMVALILLLAPILFWVTRRITE